LIKFYLFATIAHTRIGTGHLGKSSTIIFVDDGTVAGKHQRGGTGCRWGVAISRVKSLLYYKVENPSSNSLFIPKAGV